MGGLKLEDFGDEDVGGVIFANPVDDPSHFDTLSTSASEGEDAPPRRASPTIGQKRTRDKRVSPLLEQLAGTFDREELQEMPLAQAIQQEEIKLRGTDQVELAIDAELAEAPEIITVTEKVEGEVVFPIASDDHSVCAEQSLDHEVEVMDDAVPTGSADLSAQLEEDLEAATARMVDHEAQQPGDPVEEAMATQPTVEAGPDNLEQHSIFAEGTLPGTPNGASTLR